MKFIDQVCLEVIAGKGGNGIISFRHESRIEKGGPDGGDGGDGGNVYFQGDSGMNTLLPLHILKHIIGNDGQNGKSKNMYGAKGKDIIVKVPFGTLVYEGNKLICDVIDDNQYLICKGGKGGHGNTRFKSSRNTVPKICENGTLGEKKIVRLELKVMADVGLVGKPNAGKSSLLKIISNAKPKISNYEFTTLVPQLGLVKSYDDHSFVVADLPGLIKGAAVGKGLGIQFLKHIERCKVIAFIIDFSTTIDEIVENFELLKDELNSFSERLKEKEFMVVANKMDVDGFDNNYKLFVKKYSNINIIKISALNNLNINQLKEKMFELVKNAKNVVTEEFENEIEITFEEDFVVKKIHEGLYEITGNKIEEVYQRNPLNSYENILRFNKKIKDMGIWKSLIEQGIKNGDTVRIMGYQFDWEDDE